MPHIPKITKKLVWLVNEMCGAKYQFPCRRNKINLPSWELILSLCQRFAIPMTPNWNSWTFKYNSLVSSPMGRQILKLKVWSHHYCSSGQGGVRIGAGTAEATGRQRGGNQHVICYSSRIKCISQNIYWLCLLHLISIYFCIFCIIMGFHWYTAVVLKIRDVLCDLTEGGVRGD